MTRTATPHAWRRHRDREMHGGRITPEAYIADIRRQASAGVPVECRRRSQVRERLVSTLPTDPFEQLAVERGLRISAERVSLAPRDLAAPPDEAEQCYLITVTGPEGGAVARLAFVRALQDPDAPGVRDALWWLASDAWAVEQSGGDVGRWAAMQRLTPSEPVAGREFGYHHAQARSLAQALGDDAYRQLLATYEASVRRADSLVETIIEPRESQQHRL